MPAPSTGPIRREAVDDAAEDFQQLADTVVGLRLVDDLSGVGFRFPSGLELPESGRKPEAEQNGLVSWRNPFELGEKVPSRKGRPWVLRADAFPGFRGESTHSGTGRPGSGRRSRGARASTAKRSSCPEPRNFLQNILDISSKFQQLSSYPSSSAFAR